MRTALKLAAATAASLFLAAPTALDAQTAGIALTIEKHANLTAQGVVVIRVHVTCGPFAGFEDFQEAFAGATQPKTGAEAEGGMDGTVVCDGVERVHTAHLSPFTEVSFRHGPAGAGAALHVCMLVGDEQQCHQGSVNRRVILRGAAAR
jgi:hypothetical protein